MFLRCSEFEPNCWNVTRFSNFCLEQYGVTPDSQGTSARFGAGNIGAASNILLSNGVLDPWRGGGVVTNVSSSVTALVIPHSAHHFDLRASDPRDPIEVVEAREVEARVIAPWLGRTV